MGYSPKMLGWILHKTLESHRTKLTKPVYPEIKIQWIRQVALSIIDHIESEVKKFNYRHPGNELKPQDIVSAAQTALNMILKAMGSKVKRD